MLAAIRYHQPKTVVIAERIPALRRAYQMVRDQPDLFSLKYRLLMKSIQTWDGAQALIAEPEDGDPVRFAAGCECSFGGKKGHGLAHNTTRRAATGRQNVDHQRRFGRISFLLRLPARLLIVTDFREALAYDGAVFADPPYLGTGGYSDLWSAEADRELAALLRARNSALVSTYSLDLYPEEAWARLSPPVSVRNSVAAANGIKGRKLHREGYFWRRP